MRYLGLLGVINFLSFLSPAWTAKLDPQTFAETDFDFLVVGGGTAGTTLAVRLSEISNFTVGIIEAGHWDPDDDRINIPKGHVIWGTETDPFYSWNFDTAPQRKFGGRRMHMPRGKYLGGSSAINDLGLFLGPAVEYDEIGSLGNPGWSYENTLKYFKKATNMSEAPLHIQEETHGIFDQSTHGTSGPVKQSFSSWWSQVIPNFYNTMTSLGYEITVDESNSLQTGVAWNPPLNIDQGTKTRSYAGNAYYEPNQGRQNLHLVTEAHVTKINFSRFTRRRQVFATGVNFVANGESYTVRARKEVILSAGSVQSPQLLELSGIGNRRLLRKMGIRTIVDLPGVGENYQDHVITTQAVKLADGIDSWDVFFNPHQNASAFQEYQVNRTGQYASSINALAFASALETIGDRDELENKLRDLDREFYASRPSRGRRAVYEIERRRYLANSVFMEFYLAPILSFPQFFEPNASYAHFASIPQHQISRGSIHIASTDPLTPPIIDPNMWDFDFDRWVHVKGAKYVREKFVEAEGLASSIASLVHPQEINSEEEWTSFVAETSNKPAHPCCTNAMLPRGWDGVVDPTLKIYGTKNVRVVDISILPFTLATHTAGTAYAIAEQAADIIKSAYGYPITP